jgi:hypothetical protein
MPLVGCPVPLRLDPLAVLIDTMPLRLGPLPLHLGAPVVFLILVGVACALLPLPGLGMRRDRQGGEGEEGGEQGTTSHGVSNQLEPKERP